MRATFAVIAFVIAANACAEAPDAGALVLSDAAGAQVAVLVR